MVTIAGKSGMGRVWVYRLGAAILLCSVCSTFALGAWSILAGRDLQASLNRSYAVESLQQRITAAFRANSQQAISNAVAEALSESWGFQRLSVRNAEGRVLTDQNQVQKGLIQTFTAVFLPNYQGQLAIKDADSILGSVDYSMGEVSTELVQLEAVSRLKTTGYIATLLALLIGAAGTMLLRAAWVPRATTVRLDTRMELPVLTPSAKLAAPAEPELPAESLIESKDLLEQLRIGLVYVDAELRVTSMNRIAARLTGWTESDAVGQLIYTVFQCRDEHDASTVSPAERTVREDIGISEQIFLLKQRGSANTVHTVEAQSVRKLLPDGRTGALMLVKEVGRRVAAQSDVVMRARITESVIDQLAEGVFTTDVNGQIRSANAHAQMLFGYTAEEMRTMSVQRLLPVPFMNTAGIKLTDYCPGGAARLPKVAGWRKDATTFPIDLVVHPLNVLGQQRLVVVIKDRTSESRNNSLAQRLGRLLDNASEEVYIFDAQSLYFIEVNKGARRNLGLSAEQLLRMTLLNVATDLEMPTLQGYLMRLRGGDTEVISYCATHRRANNSVYPVEVRLSFSRDEEPPVFMAVALDITEREASERRMRQLVHFDALTGLPNRTLLFDRMKQAMLAARRDRRQLAIFFLDLNGFKPVNDTYGHESGDLVLKIVSERLLTELRAVDTVARLGGDEFVVLAQGIRDLADVQQLVQKIHGAFNEPIEIQKNSIRISTSIGVTLYPSDNSDAEGLLRHADEAMYSAKHSGERQFAIYKIAEGQQTGGASLVELDHRPDLARELPSSLAAGQLRLDLLPVAAVQNQAIAAIQISFKWQHPVLGEISVEDARYAAKRSGLNAELERWMLNEVVNQRHIGSRQGLPFIPAIMTLTARQWRDHDFAEKLAEKFHGLQAAYSIFIPVINQADWLDAAGAIQMLWMPLLRQGMRIALRDPDPEQNLSIVGLFILPERYAASVGEDPEIAERVRRVVELGRPILAEGVANSLQRERLKMLGVTHFSGPAIAPLLEPVMVSAWLAGHQIDML